MNGDLAGKVARVQRELQQLKYPAVADETGLRLGDPVALLPLLHFVLLKFSRHVAQCIHKAGYELQGKTDAKFVEGAFRLMRDAFSIKTVLTAAHFLEQGFAERKLLLLCDVIQCCKKIHNDEIRKERLAALKTRPGGPTDSRLSEPSRKAPDVKIVKGGWEVRQVMQLQHMPNSSDGGHSVFQVKRQIVTASPAATPPPSSQPAAGPSLRHATAMPPSRSPHSAAPSAPWEPAPAQPWSSPSVQAGQAAADSRDQHPGTAGGQGSGLAALSTPIHSWFVNPTFREPPEENGAGPSPGPQQPGGSHTAHLTAAYLAAPVAVSRGMAAGQGGAGPAGCSAPGSWWDPSEGEGSRGLSQPSAGRAAAAGAGLADSGLGGLGAEGGSRGVASGLHAGPAWFSGAPLSGPPGCQSEGTAAGGQGPHGPSQTGSASEGNRHQELAQAPTQAVNSAAWSWAPAAEARQAGSQGAMPNGFHSHSSSGPGSSADGPVPELGRSTHKPTGPPYFNPDQPRHASPAPSQQQPPGAGHAPAQLTASQAEAQGAAAGVSPAEVDAAVRAVRAELAAQVEALRQRLEEAEQRAERARSAQQAASEAAAARLTVLEGRLRFLECELEQCVRRGEYGRAGSPRAPPPTGPPCPPPPQSTAAGSTWSAAGSGAEQSRLASKPHPAAASGSSWGGFGSPNSPSRASSPRPAAYPRPAAGQAGTGAGQEPGPPRTWPSHSAAAPGPPPPSTMVGQRLPASAPAPAAPPAQGGHLSHPLLPRADWAASRELTQAAQHQQHSLASAPSLALDAPMQPARSPSGSGPPSQQRSSANTSAEVSSSSSAQVSSSSPRTRHHAWTAPTAAQQGQLELRAGQPMVGVAPTPSFAFRPTLHWQPAPGPTSSAASSPACDPPPPPHQAPCPEPSWQRSSSSSSSQAPPHPPALQTSPPSRLGSPFCPPDLPASPDQPDALHLAPGGQQLPTAVRLRGQVATTALRDSWQAGSAGERAQQPGSGGLGAAWRSAGPAEQQGQGPDPQLRHSAAQVCATEHSAGPTPPQSVDPVWWRENPAAWDEVRQEQQQHQASHHLHPQEDQGQQHSWQPPPCTQHQPDPAHPAPRPQHPDAPPATQDFAQAASSSPAGQQQQHDSGHPAGVRAAATSQAAGGTHGLPSPSAGVSQVAPSAYKGSTSDLISSLFARYSSAQAFLEEVRRK